MIVPPTATSGVEQVLDLGFGACKLQVQVPEKGDVTDPKQLVGRNIVTSFTNLAAKYFGDLEAQNETPVTNGEPTITNGDAAIMNGDAARTQKGVRTTIKYVGGSVEAACALGVADGIVDLVGMSST